MLQAEQLGKTGQVFTLPPTSEKLPVLPKRPFGPQYRSSFGLGYGRFDVLPQKEDWSWLIATLLYVLLDSAQPTFKLGALKRQKFTPQGKEQRIRNSLAALNGAQTISLTASQW